MERDNGSISKDFLPYLSESLPTIGIITSVPSPIICTKLNPIIIIFYTTSYIQHTNIMHSYIQTKLFYAQPKMFILCSGDYQCCTLRSCIYRKEKEKLLETYHVIQSDFALLIFFFVDKAFNVENAKKKGLLGNLMMD